MTHNCKTYGISLLSFLTSIVSCSHPIFSGVIFLSLNAYVSPNTIVSRTKTVSFTTGSSYAPIHVMSSRDSPRWSVSTFSRRGKRMDLPSESLSDIRATVGVKPPLSFRTNSSLLSVSNKFFSRFSLSDRFMLSDQPDISVMPDWNKLWFTKSK